MILLMCALLLDVYKCRVSYICIKGVFVQSGAFVLGLGCSCNEYISSQVCAYHGMWGDPEPSWKLDCPIDHFAIWLSGCDSHSQALQYFRKVKGI